jgi:hypothetical protein
MLKYYNIYMTMATRYTINDFENIMFGGIDFRLPQETINIITSIADQVGAADYVRTPQFNKKSNTVTGAGAGAGYAKKKYRNQEIQDDDWDAIRKFQTTEIKKREGIEANIDNIRKHLNKITEKNYDKLYEQISEEIRQISDATQDDLNKIGEAVFNIASGNAFYSKTYAKLYKDLMTNYNFMANIFNDSLSKFSELFTTIEYYNPNTDYDKFCENNKTNDKRRALSTFYVNLMKEGVLEKNNMINIIKNIQTYMQGKINQEGNKEIVDELSENIFILITNSAEELEDDDDWESIIDNVTTYSKAKVKDFPSATTKSIFKHMDILDEL